MITNSVDCRVYPYHPDCRGMKNIVNNMHELLGAGSDKVLALLVDDQGQIVSFMTTHVSTDLISTLQSFVFAFEGMKSVFMGVL